MYHEKHLGLKIHMNGRIYDPELGRFLQADPLIQDFTNPQSLNRYSYVFNNPLAYTDPTGYSAFSKYLRPILAIGAAYFTAGWSTSLFAAGNTAGALAVSIGGGALTGAIATGSGKGALIGAFTGAAAFGVGSSIAGGGSNGVSDSMARAGAQALAGGLQGQVNHGSFGAGFVAAFSVEYELGMVAGGSANAVTQGGDDAGVPEDERRQSLQSKIDALVADNTLSAARTFDSADLAATEVLVLMAPLAREYRLETYGNIIKGSGNWWTYTIPEIGEEISASIWPGAPGYHTHPYGKLMFTNQFSQSPGNDARWVKKTKHDLYLGIQLKIGGSIKIGVCSTGPGNCLDLGRIGTPPTRVIQ